MLWETDYLIRLNLIIRNITIVISFFCKVNLIGFEAIILFFERETSVCQKQRYRMLRSFKIKYRRETLMRRVKS